MTKKAKSKSVFKVLLKILLVLLILAIVGVGSLVLVNKHVIDSTRGDVYTLDGFISNNNSHYDCVIVLGCAVWGNTPSPLLKDRLLTAVSVYNSGCCDYILVSGDGLNPLDYDEIGPMTDFLIEEGIPADKIKKDPLGLSTYESMLRAEKEFGISSAVIVTSDFHLARALYDARAFDYLSVGVEAIQSGYTLSKSNYEREFLARGKDFVFALIKPGR